MSETSHAGPILLELFTSQGCSSCPPADEYLSELAAADPTGERIVPLSFHVDYWNYIGWTDPFSDESWSKRQRAYGQIFQESRVYTPQLVVDGRVHCVGSQRACVRREIEAALERPARASVTLDLSNAEDAVVANVQAGWLKGTGSGRSSDAVLMVALYERKLTTEVRHGENARRTLHNDFVVRRLERAGSLQSQETGTKTVQVRLPVEKGWDRDRLGVAVFVQDTATQEVFATARRSASSS